MYKKILLAVIALLMLPSLAWSRAYLIVLDEKLLKTPNYAGTYDGIPLPVINELKQYFNAKVDVIGIDANGTSPLGRYINKNYDLIITVGYEISEVGRMAAVNNQRQKFAIIDSYRQTTMPENAISYRFNDALGSFMAGYLAAKMSARGTIAFLGDRPNLKTHNLYQGFKDGAKLANPKIRIELDYTQDLYDHRAGLSKANYFFKGKTDVIFHAAGYSGQGVIQSAERTKKWTIGVNTDLYPTLNRSAILTSVVTDYNMAIMEACIAVESGNFTGGESVLLTLSNYGVALGDTANVPPEIVHELEQLRTDIINGDIIVRDYYKKILLPTPPTQD